LEHLHLPGEIARLFGQLTKCSSPGSFVYLDVAPEHHKLPHPEMAMEEKARHSLTVAQNEEAYGVIHRSRRGVNVSHEPSLWVKRYAGIIPSI
jgi:hypothetical protein